MLTKSRYESNLERKWYSGWGEGRRVEIKFGFFSQPSATLDSSWSHEIFCISAKGWICGLWWWSFSHWRRLLERWCGKGWWHLALLGQGGSLARTALREVPEFGLLALGLTQWEKPALSSSLEECFFFFLMLLLFPRRLPWVYKWLHFPLAWQLQLHLFSCEPGVRSG